MHSRTWKERDSGMKRCIFYLPYKLDEKATGARMVRPRKMIQAFLDIGYDVAVIEGTSKERRPLIKAIKKRIANGEQFDFMYTEAHTEPTLLTDPHHLPTHPMLDFDFFKYARKHGIRIGLFYPDVYWKFDTYGTGLPKWKKHGALLCYRYDIYKYQELLTKFYVADLKICEYLGNERLTEIASELPPGAEELLAEHRDYKNRDFSKDPLKLFYVGGLGNHYQIAELAEAVHSVKNCELTLCCREEEWEKEKSNFEPYLDGSIHIIHKSGDELEEYYKRADLCSLMFKPNIYMEMAKPFKAYEYLAHELPVLSAKSTGIGAFVEKNGIGWNIEYSASVIAETLKAIIDDPSVIVEKREKCAAAKKQNLWVSRAKQVSADLT